MLCYYIHIVYADIYAFKTNMAVVVNFSCAGRDDTTRVKHAKRRNARVASALLVGSVSQSTRSPDERVEWRWILFIKLRKTFALSRVACERKSVFFLTHKSAASVLWWCCACASCGCPRLFSSIGHRFVLERVRAKANVPFRAFCVTCFAGAVRIASSGARVLPVLLIPVVVSSLPHNPHHLYNKHSAHAAIITLHCRGAVCPPHLSYLYCVHLPPPILFGPVKDAQNKRKLCQPPPPIMMIAFFSLVYGDACKVADLQKW